MGKFDGKKLLVLGTSVGSVEIVKYAKEQGAYVIVTDYLPIEKSSAKKYADEVYSISTTDIESLCQLGMEKKIDGVFCGVSEINLVSVNKIANHLGLPCYFTQRQWEVCENKLYFKNLCKNFGVSVAEEYTYSQVFDKSIKFPVIVKPVDQSSAIGIKVCNNEEELKIAYEQAKKKSICGEALIERFVVGQEFSAAYTIINGEYRLSMMGDKYLNTKENGVLPLPDAYVYPSKYLSKYISQLNENVIRMFKSIGLVNGTVFVQGIANDNELVLFEAGLRMGGTALFRFIEKINNINILKLLVDYSLTGRMDANINLEDPTLKGKRCCLLSLLNKGGVISKIKGVEEASLIDGVEETIVRYNEGDTIIKSGTLKQSHIRFFVIRESALDLKESINKIKKLVSVTDINGDNMIFSDFDTLNLLY